MTELLTSWHHLTYLCWESKNYFEATLHYSCSTVPYSIHLFRPPILPVRVPPEANLVATLALHYTRPDWENVKIRGWKQFGNYRYPQNTSKRSTILGNPHTWSKIAGLTKESSKSFFLKKCKRHNSAEEATLNKIAIRMTSHHPNSCHRRKSPFSNLVWSHFNLWQKKWLNLVCRKTGSFPLYVVGGGTTQSTCSLALASKSSKAAVTTLAWAMEAWDFWCGVKLEHPNHVILIGISWCASCCMHHDVVLSFD